MRIAASEGEVGKCGGAVHRSPTGGFVDGIPIEQVNVSQTINAPASVCRDVLVVAKSGRAGERFRPLRTHILKYIAQKGGSIR